MTIFLLWSMGYLMLGALLGALARAWWRRVHGSWLPRSGAAWLALCTPYELPGLVLVVFALTRLPFGVSVSGTVGGSFTELELLVVATAFVCVWHLRAARNWRERVAGFVLLVAPGLVPIALWMAWSGHPVIAIGILDTTWSDLSVPLATVLFLGAAYEALSRSPTEVLPEPEADFDGGYRFDFVTRSAAVSVAVAIGSAVLVVPGIVLALFPALRGGRAVTVRILGEAVEIREPGRVVQLSMHGGRVERVDDWFGWEGLVLRSREQTVYLGLGSVPERRVDALVWRIEEATRAIPAPPPVPVPQALRNLRRQLE